MINFIQNEMKVYSQLLFSLLHDIVDFINNNTKIVSLILHEKYQQMI